VQFLCLFRKISSFDAPCARVYTKRCAADFITLISKKIIVHAYNVIQPINYVNRLARCRHKNNVVAGARVYGQSPPSQNPSQR